MLNTLCVNIAGMSVLIRRYNAIAIHDIFDF